MERVIRKPAAFVLTITLIFGAFVFPSFAGSSIYSEASIANNVDTGFEKQTEISEVKAQSYDGVRTLNSDSHSGRFSLKLGKAGLSGSAICHIINNDIDLTKYNQVSIWIKPKGYNIPFSLYTDISGTRTTIGSIEAAALKADVWQQVSFDLTSVSATAVHGLYTYAYPGKSLLIDDISFSKSFANSESWNLSAASSSNTLPSVFSYQNNVGITLKSESTNPSAYQNGAKVASIENSVSGQITDINIDSTKSEVDGSLIPAGGATYIDYILSNSALYTISKDCRMVYYYDKSTNSVKAKDQMANTTRKIFDGPVRMIKTNDNGSILLIQDQDKTSYLIKNAATTSLTNVTGQSIKITGGTISNINFRGADLYFVSDDTLYVSKAMNNYKPEKISDFYYYEMGYKDLGISPEQNGKSRYSYYFTYGHASYPNRYILYVNRHDNFLLSNPDTMVKYYDLSNADSEYYGYGITSINPTSSIIVFKYNLSGDYYAITNTDTSNPSSMISLGKTPNYYFSGDYVFYNTNCKTPNFKSVNELNSSLDVDKTGDNLLLVKNYSNIYRINKSYNYDSELLYQFSASASFTAKPASNAAIVTAKFSTLPNQAIVQMENGDIYSIDTRTKTSRLLINNMVLYDVLDQGRLLLSDMKDTGRFLIYDPTSNSKEVFRLDNRSTGAAFTVQYNEDAKTVYYLNNENKMQILQLTGAETQDKYAFMLNNDNKWWVYKNNAWKTIYNGSDDPSAELMGNMGMTAAEVNAITEKDFQKLPENAKADTLRIAVYLHSSSPYATPVLKSINVSTKDTGAERDSKTAYGARIKEYNKADFRDVSAIHVTENKDAADEIFYFLTVNGTLYSIRNGEVCDIGKDAAQLFGNVKDNYMDVMSYGMSARELSDFPADALKQTLISNNTTDKFGIVAVIKTIGKDTKEVKLDYALESLQKRFDDAVTSVSITLTDNTVIQYTSGEVSKEEIEKFADWVMDRKYNRGPVFFTFHVGNQYKIINYYMIKMFSVE